MGAQQLADHAVEAAGHFADFIAAGYRNLLGQIAPRGFYHRRGHLADGPHDLAADHIPGDADSGQQQREHQDQRPLPGISHPVLHRSHGCGELDQAPDALFSTMTFVAVIFVDDGCQEGKHALAGRVELVIGSGLALVDGFNQRRHILG